MEVSPMGLRARERLMRARALIRQKYGNSPACASLKSVAATVASTPTKLSFGNPPHQQLHHTIANKENNGTNRNTSGRGMAHHQRFTPRTKTKRRIEHAKQMTFDSIFHEEFGDNASASASAHWQPPQQQLQQQQSARMLPSASSFGYVPSANHLSLGHNTNSSSNPLLKSSRISRIMRPTKMKTPKKYNNSLKRSRTLEESSAEKKLVFRRLKTSHHFTSLSQ